MQRDERFELTKEYTDQGLPHPVDVMAAMTVEGIIFGDLNEDDLECQFEGKSIFNNYNMEIGLEQRVHQTDDPARRGGLPGD
tara:strand:+ start:202 stop:447 length:246 start_codon:yes stop_codon:yes gene_type:complete